MTAPQLPEARLRELAASRTVTPEKRAMAADLLAARETIEDLQVSNSNLIAEALKNDNLRQERDDARAEVERGAKQRDELIRAKTGRNPDDLLCCNGSMCGCQGVTVRDYELHFADRAIEAAEQPKPAKPTQEPWQFDYGGPAFPQQPKPAGGK